MIYIDNGTGYHTSKYTTKICAEVELLHMIWLVQLLDLKLIKNLWRIIKIQVSSCRYQIHSVEEIRVAISEK